MKRFNGLAVLALITLTLVACESKTSLSRAKAKHLIETSSTFTAHAGQIQLSDAEVKAGIAQGYWNINVIDTYVALTPKGKQAFISAKAQFNGSIIIQTHETIKPVITEVTGIQDTSETQKVVDFKWNLDFGNLPPELFALFKNHPSETDEAVFNLYDDGWRMERIMRP